MPEDEQKEIQVEEMSKDQLVGTVYQLQEMIEQLQRRTEGPPNYLEIELENIGRIKVQSISVSPKELMNDSYDFLNKCKLKDWRIPGPPQGKSTTPQFI